VNHLAKPETPDRTKINVQSPTEFKYWARALGVTKAQLQALVEKVGNSAATVRKELETSRQMSLSNYRQPSRAALSKTCVRFMPRRTSSRATRSPAGRCTRLGSFKDRGKSPFASPTSWRRFAR
jgi:hypothetical protein